MGIRDDDYIINVSKDVEIGKVINKIETIDKLKKYHYRVYTNIIRI